MGWFSQQNSSSIVPEARHIHAIRPWVYPLDYGYLKGTSGGDGNELDVWRGTCTEAKLDAILCTVDCFKKDVEIKLLLGCTGQEKTIIRDFHNASEYMAGILIKRYG